MHPIRTRYFLTLTAAMMAAACTEQPQSAQLTEPTPSAVRGTENIIAIQNRHTPDLMRREGIIGTGVRRGMNGEEAIVVYAVSPSHASNARVPVSLEGYP